MSLQIRPTFPFVPREAHRRSVYTVPSSGQSRLPRPNDAARRAAAEANEARFGQWRRNQRLLAPIVVRESER
jgi:hypothetical protein